MWNENELNATWYSGARPTLGMRLLEPVYRSVVALRRGAYRCGLLRSHALPVPVLVVGNITAGGTGKTPLTIALVQSLGALGWTPGVVSRGHGGSEHGPALLGTDPDPGRFGDEPCLMRQAGCGIVAVGRDRPAAARLAIEAGANLVIADDGLQHYALARDAEICVIDGQRRFGNGRMLPAGPLREPLARLGRVDWRVCNGGVPQADEIPMQLQGDAAVGLVGGERQPLSGFAGQAVHAVAGIGNPQRFFDSLREHGLQVLEHPFPDHHAWRPGELDFADGLPVLMTDKDAIKCRGMELRDAWRVPVRAGLPREFVLTLDAHLQEVQARQAGR